MKIEFFQDLLVNAKNKSDILDVCRKYILHGTPHIFQSKDSDFYEFRKRIANEFEIPFHEVFITGSAKLGFSPHKNKDFDYDSDIDVAIVSPNLYEIIMATIATYQMQFRKSRSTIREQELQMYHMFLEYTALGWIRPDKLPISFQMHELKDKWFSFFESISYGKSEVGNYKVTAGIFKSYSHLEQYTLSGLIDLKSRLDSKEKK